MPSGFEYVSSNSNSTCGYSLSNASDGNFRYAFSYSGAGAPCTSRVDFTYRITPSATAGSKTVSILNGSAQSVGNSVTVGIIAVNTIASAETIGDADSPYIESYLLSFTSPLSDISDLDGLTVGGSTILSRSASGSTGAVITFAPSTYGTYDAPQIGGVFDGVTLDDTSVNELDRAAPYLTGAVDGTYYTGSVTLGFTEGVGLLNGGAFSSGSTVTVPGSYTLVVTDTSLNSATLSFSIASDYETDAPVIGNQDVLNIGRDSAIIRFAFTDTHYTPGTATGSVTVGTGGSYTNAGSFPISVETGSTNTGSATLSGLVSGTRYDYRINLSDNFGNSSSATGSFYTAADPVTPPTPATGS
ncbi:MAG TPA: hypothetical protein PK765_02940 [bacterium]|nr:hypothetical protein [bacterium]